MDKMIHTSLTAMRGIMARQTAVANNLANASTTGFRAEIVNAKSEYLANRELDSRAFAKERVTSADLSAGTVITTGRVLDIALNDDAMLSVQGMNGEPAYTRRGDLQISDSGVVTTGSGEVVLGQSGPLTIPPVDKLMIAPDGGVWITPRGEPGGEMQQIDRLSLVSFTGSDIVKGNDNLFRVRGGGVLPADQNARLTPSSLESSNVNMTSSLIDMIEAGRAWETQIKLLSTAQELDSSGASLMQLPGS